VSDHFQEFPLEKQAFKSLAIFVGVLIVMKFFFGWNISIIGSVVLTIVLSVVMSLVNRR
jgi:diacylglycerol kinase